MILKNEKLEPNIELELKDVDIESDADLEELAEANYDEDIEDFNYEVSPDFYSDDNMSIYLRQIENYPLLTREEEAELFKRVADGDDKAKEEILIRNLKLVLYVVEKQHLPLNASIQKLDLIQEGNMGIMIAIDKFDLSKGFKFSTYAYQWIFQKIERYYANNKTTIRVPCHAHAQLNKLKRMENQFAIEHMREPNVEEIDFMIKNNLTNNTNAENIYDALKANNIESLNKITLPGEHTDDDITLESSIADTKNLLVDDAYFKVEAAEILRKQMKERLSEREIYVLTERFGLDDGITKTLEQVGKQMHITRERVRQIEAKAIRKLRRPLIRNGINSGNI